MSDEDQLREVDAPQPHLRTGRGRSHRNQLMVLGELLNAPMHGYQLREILNRVLGPFRQLSWGALYPLIHELEWDGLIESTREPETERTRTGSGTRQRHTYRLTDEGRERFHQLMREPGDYTYDYPGLFMIKLNLFGYVARGEQLAILRHYRGYLQYGVDFLLAEQQFVTKLPGIPERERPHILRLLDYRLNNLQAESAWIDRELARLNEA
jgi:DNA-binding PadR family transcriptional regulator